jgi:hypothetical protein
VAPAGLLAHGGGAQRGYVSTLTAVQPPNLGLFVDVLEGDDRLSLTNTTGEEVVVAGYEGEPYLRFAGDGVFRNVRSPATYLNEDRFAKVELPADADPEAAPEWEKVSDTTSYEWHDHRIHWMSETPPRAIRDDPDVPHHVFDWTVPATLAGEPLAIRGSLDYVPPDRGGFSLLYVLPPVLALAAAGGAWLVLRRRGAAAR